MVEATDTTVLRLLHAMEDGDREALDRLFSIVYDELRALAHRERGRWNDDAVLTTTALVHELYLKLADQTAVSAASRAHLHALSARAMRHILSNYARTQRAKKRGGATIRVPLDEEMLLAAGDDAEVGERAELLAVLDDLVGRLEQVYPRCAQVVECRFYGGMSVPDTAAALGVSPRTVKRDWVVAQAWLYRELSDGLR